MNPGNYNFTISRGDAISRILRIKSKQTDEYIDFAGYTGRCHFRDANDNKVGEGVISVNADGTGPYIKLYAAKEVTEDFEPGQVFYDVEMIDPTGDPLTWVEGVIKVRKDHTHD